MNRESMHNHRRPAAALFAVLLAGLAGASLAQVPVDGQGNPIGSAPRGATVENPTIDDATVRDAVELEELVGPVALYPDDLLAIVLPASTYPLQIVQAARFLDQVEQDPSLKPDPGWDDSVVALLNYPEVLRMMNDDIDWTWRLGEAVVAQQPDVLAAVEAFRGKAYAAGNLKSDEHQTVTRNDDDVIEIDPVEEDVIYVPYYEPERVVVYSPGPVYYYYPRPYPLYYYPYPAGHYFTAGYFWGVTTAFQIGWWDDYLHVYHCSYRGHPYYGHYYYGSYWRQPSLNVYNSYYVTNNVYGSYDRHHHGDYWRPRHNGGARPVHTSSRDTYYANYEPTRTSTREGYYRDDRLRDRRDTYVAGRASRPGERTTARGGDRAGVTSAASRDRARTFAAANDTRLRAGADGGRSTVRGPAGTGQRATPNASGTARQRVAAEREVVRRQAPAEATSGGRGRATTAATGRERGASPTARSEPARIQSRSAVTAARNEARPERSLRAPAPARSSTPIQTARAGRADGFRTQSVFAGAAAPRSTPAAPRSAAPARSIESRAAPAARAPSNNRPVASRPERSSSAGGGGRESSRGGRGKRDNHR